MNKILSPLLLASTFLGLGIAMPNCPGEQHLEQKIEALEASNKELNKKLQTITTQLQTLNTDMGQVKTLLPQVTNVLTGQKTAIDQIEAEIKTLHQSKGKSGSSKKHH